MTKCFDSNSEMLEAYIIEEEKKRELEKRLREEENRRLHVEVPCWLPRKEEEMEESAETVIKINLVD